MPSISLKSLSEPDAAPSPAPRIGIVIAHLGSGGAEKAAVVLANGLADRGYFVDLLTWQAAGVPSQRHVAKGHEDRLVSWAETQHNPSHSFPRAISAAETACNYFPSSGKTLAFGDSWRSVDRLPQNRAVYSDRSHCLRRDSSQPTTPLTPLAADLFGGRALSPNSPGCCRFGGRGANRTPAAVAVRATPSKSFTMVSTIRGLRPRRNNRSRKHGCCRGRFQSS